MHLTAHGVGAACCGNTLTRKIKRVMKITCILLLTASMHLAARTEGQTVTLKVRDVPVETVFREVSRQTNMSIIYSKAVLDQLKRVTLEAVDMPVKEVMTLCLKDQMVEFIITDNIITIKEKQAKNKQAAAGNSDNDDSPGFSPPVTVRGRIIDDKGNAVIATVTVKGAGRATTTDDNGEFLLSDVDEAATLVITSVNTETLEVKVNGRSNLETIKVLSKVEEIQEVVVNKGYYSTTRKLNTGNVTRITAATIEKQPVSNALQALQGRVAGMQIIQNTGVPGGGYSVRIRGRNNLRPNADLPLFIVDGVPYSSGPLHSELGEFITLGGNPLNLINPLDIESIEVLKDGDATAIYGSRGANGIVLITTKKGRVGSTKVDINYYGGVGAVARKMKLLSTAQYLEMRNEAFTNTGLTPGATDYDLNGTWDKNRNTDWQEVFLGGAAQIHNAQASLSGGTSKTRFYLGGGYSSEGTVFPGDFGNKKASGHFNLTHGSTNGRLNAQISATFMNEQNKLFTYDIANDALTLPPNAPELYLSDGSLNWQNQSWDNPVGYLQQWYKTRTNNLITNARISYRLLPSLEIGFSSGYTNTALKEIGISPLTSWNPAHGITESESNLSTSDLQTWIIEPQAEFKRSFGKSKLTIIAGLTFQRNRTERLGLKGSGFVNDNLLENIQAAANVSVVGFTDNIYKYNALYGRLNYDYDQKYIVNITARRDGSSRFGPGKQFANFGAIGAAWILSNEKFMKAVSFISFAKIRSSYGTTGSDQIGDYGFIDLWSSTAYPYNGSQGLYPRTLFNEDYAWEVNRKFEIALELGILDNRINLNAGFYRNITPNQLILQALPRTTGFASIQENFPAVVENKGFEIELNTVNYKHKSFRWTSSFNITIPKNTLLRFPGIEASTYAVTYKVGRSLYTQNTLHYLGVDPATGVIQYQDLNNDGVVNNTQDRSFFKEIAQQYYAGLENTITYKGFELNFLFYYVKQTGKTYQSSFYGPPGFRINQPTIVMDRWRKAGDVTDIQRFTSTTDDAYIAYLSTGDNKIGDASFLRLKSFRLAYDFPDELLRKLKLRQLRFYLQGQNLLTFTNYIGLDPEANNNFSLPPLRMITIGIQTNL